MAPPEVTAAVISDIMLNRLELLSYDMFVEMASTSDNTSLFSEFPVLGLRGHPL